MLRRPSYEKYCTDLRPRDGWRMACLCAIEIFVAFDRLRSAINPTDQPPEIKLIYACLAYHWCLARDRLGFCPGVSTGPWKCGFGDMSYSGRGYRTAIDSRLIYLLLCYFSLFLSWLITLELLTIYLWLDHHSHDLLIRGSRFGGPNQHCSNGSWELRVVQEGCRRSRRATRRVANRLYY